MGGVRYGSELKVCSGFVSLELVVSGTGFVQFCLELLVWWVAYGRVP